MPCLPLRSRDGHPGSVQVYTAEEKAALAMLNVEENKKKEDKILGDMRNLVQRSMAQEADFDAPDVAAEAAD